MISTVLLTGLIGSAFAGPATTKSLIDEASASAKKENKNVMVIFHASWCGWCKKMDAFLEKPEFKKAFEKSYSIVHVDVMENGPKKELENEGGQELMEKLGGKTAGLPFFAILTPDGKKLTDSILPKTGNTGFPSEAYEVAGFKDILTKTAPHMSRADIQKITAFLSVKQQH